MNITNNTNLPEPIYQALTRNSYSRGDSNRSVTQLIDSPRVRILRKEHADEITEDASEMVWAVLGTAVHKMFEEQDADGHTAEERLFVDVDGWTISGAIDLQVSSDDNTVILYDYKCTSTWSVIFGKDEWHTQLNLYAHLVEMSKPYTVSGLRIVVVLRDWMETKANTDKSYPQSPIQVIDIPLWDYEKRDAYLRERVKLHSDAEFERLTGGDIPPCLPAERWAKPSTYACKKPKNKRAVRVFDSMEEAEKYCADNAGLAVEVRQGEFTRCVRNFCRVAEWCDQYQGELNEQQQGKTGEDSGPDSGQQETADGNQAD